MEILTLIKANVRHKKGLFISVILLTMIIAMSVTTVLSIQKSALAGVSYAHELCGSPDVMAMYMSHNLTDDIIDKVKNDSRVDSVKVTEGIIIDRAIMNGSEYSNIVFVFGDDENNRLLNEDLNEISANAPKLKKGEIYVPQGLLTDMNGKVGDKIVIETIADDYQFTVAGILFDPMCGSALMGWKNFYISNEDYSEIRLEILKAETENNHAIGNILEIKKADNCNLSDIQLRRQLNLDYGITDMAIGSLTKDMSVHYTTLFVEVVSSVLLVFVIVLLAIVVIVTVHSISVEIETEYVTFGVLKAQGFGYSKICLLFLGEYLFAEMVGAALGIALSIPIIGLLSNIFVTITSIPSVVSIPADMITVIILALFILSAVSTLFITAKFNKISPVRAISGAKKEIYFDSRIKAPISKGLLSPSLALRQFTSAKRRYIGTLVIVMILVFFMTTVALLADALNSKSALEAMGTMVEDIIVYPKEELSDDDYKRIEKEIETFSPIKKAYYTRNSYFSFNGEEMYCAVYKDPSMLPAIKGRTPVYDNEIAVSPILLDEFNIKIGDEITVGWKNKKDKYIIVGTVQLINDAGRCFLMSHDAAEKIGFDLWLLGGYLLDMKEDEENNDNSTLIQYIADRLNEKFGSIIEAKPSSNLIDDTTDTAIKAIQAIIYSFSVIFSLIVVIMVCSKAFVQERTDIGIYKAVGFGSQNLRLQFAVRFFIVSVMGSVIGGFLSYFLSGNVLTVLLRSIGVTNFKTNVDFSSFAIPILIISASFALFSYFVSGKVKNVKIRELVTE
ncbi:MAG: ABC transporter permease [Ruminococcaceae bacterium]|nr:ABC transporter permease [Oscillospiraceae bacterium]